MIEKARLALASDHASVCLQTFEGFIASSNGEALQFALWRDWISENLEGVGRGKQVGEWDWVPDQHRGAPENNPSTLLEQLEALEQAGFSDATCHWKYSVLAVFGGTKS